MASAYQGNIGQPLGCIFTNLVAGSAALSVPTDFAGASRTTTLYVGNVIGPTSIGVNIFGLTLSAATTAARTLTIYGAKSDLTTYDQRPYGLTVKSGASAGDYFPIGGPRGYFLDTRAANGFTPGGGFAFITSNAELLGSLWWEPVGSY